MSRRKKRREEAPLPALSAGLLRFFEEETSGVRLRPEIIIILSAGLIIMSIILPILYPPI